MALVATLLAYHRGLHFSFALDDYTYLFRAAGIDAAPFELRRWLTVRVFYELGLRLFGVDSTLRWHLLTWTLHVANAVWVFLLGRRLGVTRLAAWLAGGLFAASPVDFTVLYWVAGVQEIASACFVLAATWVALRADRARWLAVPLFALAMLCKESVLAFPLALAGLLGRRGLRLAGAMLATGVVLFLASGLQHRMFDTRGTSPYATSSGMSLLVNLATLVTWFAAPWHPYPDRIASPNPALVPWAFGIVGFGAAALLVNRRRGARAVGLAALWFVALLLPVLPLRTHSYAYYLYLPQIGFLLLVAVAVEGVAQRLAGTDRAAEPTRPKRGAPPAGAQPAATSPPARESQRGLAFPAVAALLTLAGCVTFASRNSRIHETLMLGTSDVPHDSVVRYSRVSGDVVAQVRSAPFPASVHRVALLGYTQPGAAAHTPGATNVPESKRIQIQPIRMALQEGKLLRLHLPKLEGGFVDSLTERDESPDTAIFFASGLSHLEYIADPAEAYAMVAQACLVTNRVADAERPLRRALALRPEHPVARILLSGLRAESGDLPEAKSLLAAVNPAKVPEALRPYYTQLKSQLEHP